ncbi:MAG: FKBP-type peptidyl-prolyl cis-trans isomerase [Thermodesulfobacteriota bacterium]
MRKKIAIALCFCLVLAGLVACSQGPEGRAKDLELKTFTDKVSYVLGIDIGTSLRETKTEINFDALYRGIEDIMNERDLMLDPEQIEALKLEFAQKLQQEYAARIEEAGQKNLAEGEAFLKENKDKDGIVTTVSGLQFKVITEGDGPLPAATDRVKVHYRGTLINGKEFDSSFERQEPVIFQLDSVIPGWVEALQMMKVGSKYQLFIPSDLAYGAREVGPDIGPNTTLIFEVELLGIE